MNDDNRHLRPVEGGAVDSVARWRSLLADYPEARYTFAAPFFTGALRDDDDVIQRTSLGLLIDALLFREAGRFFPRPHP